jgi:hypothetical protein
MHKFRCRTSTQDDERNLMEIAIKIAIEKQQSVIFEVVTEVNFL